MAIDLDKVKAAAEALGKLNKVEMDLLKAFVQMSWGTGAAKNVAALSGEPTEPDTRTRGPDPRGRYRCRYCEKVLPTKRGRGIHEAAHERNTAPVGAT